MTWLDRSFITVCMVVVLISPVPAGEINAGLLDRLTEEIDTRNIHAVLVLRDGKLLFEHYSSGEDEEWGQKLGIVKFDTDTLHDLRSGTKSIISALIGIAIGEGKIPGLNTPVTSLLNEDYLASFQPPPGNQPLLLEHLLSMTAGFEWNETVSYTDPRNSEIRMWNSDSPAAFALSQGYNNPPGIEFHYNGGLTQILLTILEENTGLPAEAYARKKLFEPLDINYYSWVRHKSGRAWGPSGLRMTARDYAKIGLLYLQDGRWQGKRILPPGWVESTFTSRISTGFPTKIGYGLHWWLPVYAQPDGEIQTAMAQGNGGQTLLLFPDYDLLIVTLAGYYNQVTETVRLPHRLAQEYVLPAVGIADTRVARSRPPKK